MCGIVGIYHFDPERPVVEAHVRAMADRIVHRGPDDAGYHVDRNVGLGMRRLSIIDVTGGHQPIFTPDGRYAIVFNGEVYNFREERPALEARGHTFTTHTDTEVVLHLYAEHGLKFLDHLNGMFGLAIWDAEERTLLLVRDRIGIKPLYYYQDGDKLLFASEIKALLTHPEVRAEIDPEGLSAFLKYGFTPAPYTTFAKIHKLPPGHLMRVQGRAISTEEYWRPRYADKLTGNENEIAGQVYDLLKSAVRYQMIADVPLGAFLSSGIDSSGIVHLMRELGTQHVSTYSVGFGPAYAMHDELAGARQFAHDYDTSHHEITVEPDVANLLPQLTVALDEPLADSSFLVTYLVARLARETVKVILSGVGGDELYGGYRRYLNVRLNRYTSYLPQSVRTHLLGRIARVLPADRNSHMLNYLRLAKTYLGNAALPVDRQYGVFTNVFQDDFRADLIGHAADVPDFYARYTAECDSDDLLDQVMYYDLRTSLPEQLLMLSDKMTMAVSLEARVPYLDHRLVEHAARMPGHIKIRGFNLRAVQKNALRGRIPDYVFKRRKRGFGAPVGAWIRGALRVLVRDLLSRERLQRQGLFDSVIVNRMLNDHDAKREDHADQILALLSFQIWYDQYVSRPL